MRVCIPETFKLAGKTWTVRVVDQETLREQAAILDGTELMGLCTSHDSTIWLCDETKGQERDHTFCHELTHAILFTLGWGKINRDEDKVDALGGMIHQFLDTKKGRVDG